jgi:hypothetical protein
LEGVIVCHLTTNKQTSVNCEDLWLVLNEKFHLKTSKIIFMVVILQVHYYYYSLNAGEWLFNKYYE